MRYSKIFFNTSPKMSFKNLIVSVHRIEGKIQNSREELCKANLLKIKHFLLNVFLLSPQFFIRYVEGCSHKN